MGLKSMKKKVVSWLKMKRITSRNIWVFGAWQGKLYGDNAKYLFEYLNEKKVNQKLVWLSYRPDIVREVRAKGYRAYSAFSLQGLYYSLRAGVAFCTEGPTDCSGYLSTHTKVIQLWHGMGIKRVGLNSGWFANGTFPGNIEKEKARYLSEDAQWYWMAASEEAVDKYAKAFLVPEDHFFITGQPKDDAFVRHSRQVPEYIQKIRDEMPGVKIAVYLPTHRNFGHTELNVDIMSFDVLQKVNGLLKAQNSMMIFKPHFHEFSKYASYSESFSNIYFATDPQKFGDVYEFLPYCDMLITDYSGIMFGYLSTGKPIIYFPYDLAEYGADYGDAGFCYDYQDITYGPICNTWEEVVEAVGKITPEDYADRRELQRQRFCPYYDGRNCERVYSSVLTLLDR